jgi:hypothetical protein
MFDSLADQMREDEAKQVKRGEVVLRWSAVALISVFVFGGLYYVVHFFE